MRFLERPQSNGLRKVLFQLHLWAGLTVALYVVLVGVTGAVLVFRPEFQAEAFPEFFAIDKGGRPDASAAEIIAALRERYPAHALLGIVSALYDYDWKESAREFGIAMAREPVPPWVRNVYSLFYLMYCGRAEDALHEMNQALSDDPLAVNLRYTMGVCLVGAGRLIEAEAQFKRVLELDPAFMTAYELQAFVHLARGDAAKACSWAGQAAKLAPWDPVVIGTHAATLGLAGDAAGGAALLGTLGDGSAFGAPIGLAVHCLLRGDLDQAADWIARAVEQRYPGILFFVHIIGTALRESSHWPRLAAMMNLPSGS